MSIPKFKGFKKVPNEPRHFDELMKAYLIDNPHQLNEISNPVENLLELETKEINHTSVKLNLH
jgi:hypothetical protein